MDGVLVDSEPVYKEVEQALCRDLGFILSDEEKKSFTGGSTIDTWTILKKRYAFDKTVEEMAENETRIMSEHYQHGELLPIETVVNLVKECSSAGIKTAVATSAVRTNAQAVIERFDLKDCVNALVSADMVERAKPAPDIFLKAASMLGAAPKECVVIEDAKRGIDAAKAAGMKAVAIIHEDNPQDLSAADAVFGVTSSISLEFLRSLAEG
jgi:HAD superfamily hydrolase (TIGR01509 family)